ncbi:hypothetical protein OF364_01690 [Mycoplasma enhydrae]|uniref:hypothetical protein n=1 Tax=Mycoplasma enhydrae TaxID=2499220 RepID=UPI00197BAE0B|nr:hypothetical protein [Mycoplasma enhydrae]MBN4089636.1 hypothetical protein [Mycoplasma enhydrae]MCV3733770.1 hypothetical protein [Mycoplasma enhydrae]MCV3753525.1 hypothetical protein [Mycoplasma enhydrae]
MKLKYILESEIDGTKNTVVETEYVDYFEDTEDKFIKIEFTDPNLQNCKLLASLNEIKVSYAKQSLHMIKNTYISNEFKLSENQSFFMDAYLLNVSIDATEISFNYDFLQNKNIIVRNTARFIIKK